MSDTANLVTLPRDSAWAANREDVRDFVVKGKDITQSRVTYLQSAHASGKSTSMLLWIMQLINQTVEKKTYPSFIYVLPNETEVKFVCDFLAQDPLQDGIFETTGMSFEDRYVITTYERFLRLQEGMLQKGEHWPKRVTIMADVELRASVAGEIFFGKLAELVRKNKPAVNLLLVSPHRSLRTLRAFQEIVGTVCEIVVPDANPQLRVKTIEGHDWMDKAARLADDVLRKDKDAKVFFGMSDASYLFSYLARQATAEVTFVNQLNVDDLKNLVKDRVLVVDPELSVSAHTHGLRLVVSQCTAESVMFDTATSQLLQRERAMTLREVEQEQSWAFKTSSEPEDVEVYVAMPENRYRHLKRSCDPWSPAWNVHLPWLALRIFSTWPDTNTGDLPIRRPPDVFAFSETIGRLARMGLLQQDKDGKGKYSCTRLGVHAFSWMNMWTHIGANATYQLQVHAAYLLAVATTKKDPPKVVRVLIRLAVISAAGIGNFCAIADPARGRPSASAIRAECEGIGRELFWKGALWTALGVYHKGLARHDFRFDSPVTLQRGQMLLDPSKGFEISQAITKIEASLGLPAPADEIQDTFLNNDEVATVERHLMWAWLHRIVGIRCKGAGDLAFDVASGHPVEVNESAELFGIRYVTNLPKNQIVGGIFAIYDRLVRSEGGKVVKAHDLTFIPQDLYQEVEKKTGLSWPLPIATKFPLRR
ncbi:hypothetical protein F4820DRAFT_470840 [Hypoxylon rubiginosum]|uniref:Uncharacterized protein n=1 Tax=Hypoxylon rubiginosum TaxID=110542 RepID=A0ACB9YXT8_9PEZI|nr:hypothetical protein F4820DRAFT_470840 [Hypoxylon rubiginosum]